MKHSELTIEEYNSFNSGHVFSDFRDLRRYVSSIIENWDSCNWGNLESFDAAVEVAADYLRCQPDWAWDEDMSAVLDREFDAGVCGALENAAAQ